VEAQGQVERARGEGAQEQRGNEEEEPPPPSALEAFPARRQRFRRALGLVGAVVETEKRPRMVGSGLRESGRPRPGGRGHRGYWPPLAAGAAEAAAPSAACCFLSSRPCFCRSWAFSRYSALARRSLVAPAFTR